MDLSFLTVHRKLFSEVESRASRVHDWMVFDLICIATASAVARCVIERYGVPRALRTDNEGAFISQTLQVVFKLFGIHPQRTKPRSPWQNGRIERLFGTLKNEFMSIVNPSLPIDVQLKLFQHYYNQQRPHQALNHQTPAQVWNAAHRDSEWRGSG